MQSKPAAVVSSFIRGALCFGGPRRNVASSFLSIASFIFYIYTTSFLIKLNVYPLYYRNTYYTTFDAHIISQSVDHLILFSLTAAWFFLSLKDIRARVVAVGIFGLALGFQASGVVGWPIDLVALLSTPAIMALLIANGLMKEKRILSVRLLVLTNHFGVTSLLLAISGLIIASAFVAGLLYNQQQPIRNYSYELFLIFNNLSPILILVLVASLPVKMLIGFITRKYLKEKDEAASGQKSKLKGKRRFYYLSFFVILSIVIGLIPHLQTINRGGQNTGVDTPYYVEWVNGLSKSQTPQEFFTNAFVTQASGGRPITLIFIYAVSKVGSLDLQTIVEYLPMILGPGLVITLYCLTLEITKDERISLIASFVTSISFHVLIGIYAGFYANWLALITGYAGILFLLRYLREQQVRDLAAFSVLLYTTLLSHVYTWSVMALVMGILLAITIYRYRDKRKGSLILMMILASSVVLDMARVATTNSAGGIERDMQLASNLTGPDQFSQRWNNLKYTSTTFVAGIFGNVVILGLGLYWMYKSKIQDLTTILMLIFFSIGMTFIVIGDWVVQTRMLYLIPFQIPAAVALSMLRDRPAGKLLFASICIWLVFLAVRTASNFYFIAPD